jgi:hypothetical protein
LPQPAQPPAHKAQERCHQSHRDQHTMRRIPTLCTSKVIQSLKPPRAHHAN